VKSGLAAGHRGRPGIWPPRPPALPAESGRLPPTHWIAGTAAGLRGRGGNNARWNDGPGVPEPGRRIAPRKPGTTSGRQAMCVFSGASEVPFEDQYSENRQSFGGARKFCAHSADLITLALRGAEADFAWGATEDRPANHEPHDGLREEACLCPPHVVRDGAGSIGGALRAKRAAPFRRSLLPALPRGAAAIRRNQRRGSDGPGAAGNAGGFSGQNRGRPRRPAPHPFFARSSRLASSRRSRRPESGFGRCVARLLAKITQGAFCQ